MDLFFSWISLANSVVLYTVFTYTQSIYMLYYTSDLWELVGSNNCNNNISGIQSNLIIDR